MQDEVFDLAGMIGPDEQLDDLQLKGLRILQKKQGFHYGMDAVLLADFAGIRPRDHVADFGTGTGILPLLLYGRGKGARFDAFELQPDMAEMAARSMRLNALTSQITVHARPVEEATDVVPPCSLDAIVANPPYGRAGTTLENPEETRRLARHQSEEGLTGWFRTAHRLLKGKGRMALIYPAPQLLSLMEQLQAGHLVPKRFRLVYPFADRPANLVLVEAVKDAKPLLHPEPPLIIYCKDGSPTEELQRIYGGSFR